MDKDLLQAKRDNAISIINRFISFLQNHDLEGWVCRFREITDALQRHDDHQAIALEKAIPRANMGSFGDFYVCGDGEETDEAAQQQFDRLSGATSKSIANLRLYREYDWDRPLVEI